MGHVAMWLTRLQITQNLFHEIHICSVVSLSYLDASFEPRCKKDFLCACKGLLLVLLAACCCYCFCCYDNTFLNPYPIVGCKTSTGRPGLVTTPC